MFISPWSLIHRRYWDPISELERSMMEMQRLADIVINPAFQSLDDDFSSLPSLVDDEEFFRDLPTGTNRPKFGEEQTQRTERGTTPSHPTETLSETTPAQPPNVERQGVGAGAAGVSDTSKRQEPSGQEATSTQQQEQQQPSQQPQRRFSSYSFSSSSILDDQGRPIQSVRRRYEDSNGRLKAEHKRKIGDRVLTSSWSRSKQGEEGDFKKSITGDINEEEFERLWENTPFSRAAREKNIEPQQETKGIEQAQQEQQPQQEMQP